MGASIPVASLSAYLRHELGSTARSLAVDCPKTSLSGDHGACPSPSSQGEDSMGESPTLMRRHHSSGHTYASPVRKHLSGGSLASANDKMGGAAWNGVGPGSGPMGG